jgi:AcrR family transcriptional regulator
MADPPRTGRPRRRRTSSASPLREQSSPEAEGLPRLPPGRHGLPRDLVAANQRGRIAAGMIAAVTERGYQGTAVAHVVAAAGVSRRTFYGRYADKAAAYFDVYSELTDLLLAAMAEARRSERGWAAGVRAQLAALLAVFDANRDLARLCLLVPPAAGGEVAAAYRRFLERLGEQLAEGRPGSARSPSPAARYGLVGGLAALVVEAAQSEDAEAFGALLPELVELVLTPYLGRGAAAARRADRAA